MLAMLFALLFSAVEARTFMTVRMLRAAHQLGDVHLSAEDRAAIAKSKPVEERYAGALALWSRYLGRGSRPEVSGPIWNKFRAARHLRDRITHPKGVTAFQFNLDELELLRAALSYFGDSTTAIFLDGDIWTSLGSNKRQAEGAAAAGTQDAR
jgi:hypothetical protein